MADEDERPSQYPSFIAFIRRSLEQGLKVPPAFMRIHGESLGENVLLIDEDAVTWEVKLTHNRQGSLLTEMGEFGQHYSVEVGEAMVFHLVGHSQLWVTIFDKDERTGRA